MRAKIPLLCQVSSTKSYYILVIFIIFIIVNIFHGSYFLCLILDKTIGPSLVKYSNSTDKNY